MRLSFDCRDGNVVIGIQLLDGQNTNYASSFLKRKCFAKVLLTLKPRPG